jgi:hypothetical protein
MLCLVRWLIAVAVFGAELLAAENSQQIVKFKLEGVALEGKPLFWNESGAAVLGCDGRLWQFEPNKTTNLHHTNETFRGHSITKMRAELQREFGPDFDVSSSGHFLVVHPRGHGREWSSRFEELYRSFRIYFSVRGFPLKEPEFPLVAVVFRNEQQFQRYAHKEKAQVSPGLLGYYSTVTNRVAMFDASNGGEAAWHVNAETIIHEAAHQSAFNTGVHNRFSPPPRWVAEGLGTLFEARGVWDSRFHARATDRVNRVQLAAFQKHAPQRKKDATVKLIGSDRQFKSDVDAAYAEAWALTYYLVETRPRQYATYLARTAQTKDFEKYTSVQRLADFTAVFGENFRLFDAQFLEFMNKVR